MGGTAGRVCRLNVIGLKISPPGATDRFEPPSPSCVYGNRYIFPKKQPRLRFGPPPAVRTKLAADCLAFSLRRSLLAPRAEYSPRLPEGLSAIENWKFSGSFGGDGGSSAESPVAEAETEEKIKLTADSLGNLKDAREALWAALEQVLVVSGMVSPHQS